MRTKTPRSPHELIFITEECLCGEITADEMIYRTKPSGERQNFSLLRMSTVV